MPVTTRLFSEEFADQVGVSVDDFSERAQILSAFREPVYGEILVDGPLNIAVLGASIMNSVFSSQSERDSFIVDFESRSGITVDSLTEYAVSGNTPADTLALLPTVLSAYEGIETATIVIYHDGGNIVSSEGPYPGGAETLDADFRNVLQQLVDAGFVVIPASMTWRVPPKSNPTAIYNEEVTIPAIREICPTAMAVDGRPLLDLWAFTRVNGGQVADGVHYTDEGQLAIARYIAKSIAPFVKSTGQIVPASTKISNVIVDFGQAGQTSDISSTGDDLPVSATGFLQEDGSTLDELTLTFTGGWTEGSNEQGISTAVTTGYSIDRTELTQDSYFLSSPSFSGYGGSDQAGIDFSGDAIEDSATYEVTLMSARNSSDDRRQGDFTVGGVTQTIDGAAGSLTLPNKATWTVTGADLRSGGITLVRANPSDSSFAYLNAIQIRKV